LCVTRTLMLSIFLFCVVVTIDVKNAWKWILLDMCINLQLMWKMPECEFYWTCASISKISVTHESW
jgi:hypothetical protein